jgi:hypothetical protein
MDRRRLKFEQDLESEGFGVIESIDSFDFGHVIIQVNLKIYKSASLGIKDTGVDAWERSVGGISLSFQSTALNGSSLVQVHALFNNIQLNQSAVTEFGILKAIQFDPVQAVNVSKVSEPVLKWGRVVISGSGSTNSTTIVVSADDNIRNLQVVDGVLKTRHEVEISVDDHICDVTQDKDRSSILSHDDIARNTGIGTSCL